MRQEALYVQSHGSGDPVLMLHGFMGSSADWLPIVDRLGSDYRCLCVDLPGHGRSINLSGSYHMNRTSRLLVRVLDDEDVDRAHVVGYSMGGRTALYFAVHHRERCNRLVLESASPGLRAFEERTARQTLDEDRAGRIESGDYPAFLEEWYRQPLFETYRQQEGLLQRMIRSRRSNAPRELARSLREMGTGSQPSLWDRLGEIDLEVLLTVGALDERYVQLARRMADHLPRARTAVVRGAGHNGHAERPEEFSTILADFFKQPV